MVPKEFDVTPFEDLIARARSAFLEDPNYAIAIAKAGASVLSKRKGKDDSLTDTTL